MLTIDEAIAALEEAKRRYGDMPVVIRRDSGGMNGDFEVCFPKVELVNSHQPYRDREDDGEKIFYRAKPKSKVRTPVFVFE